MKAIKLLCVGVITALAMLGALAPVPVLASDTGTAVIVTVSAATTETPASINDDGVVLLEDAAYTDEPQSVTLPTAGDTGQLVVSLGILVMSLAYLGATIYQQRTAKA